MDEGREPQRQRRRRNFQLRGHGKGRECCLSHQEKREASIVPKMLEAMEPGQGQRNPRVRSWVVASSGMGWKEGVGKAADELWEDCHLLRLCGEVMR